MPKYSKLNDYQTLYFNNFLNLRVYTIKAGLIEKLPCRSEPPYTFNLIDTSSLNIPNEVIIDIPVLINNDENYIAKCLVKNSERYNMSCNISDIKCNNCLNDICIKNCSVKCKFCSKLYCNKCTLVCSICKKNTAVIFINKINGNESSVEGLCYSCAKEKGINPLEVLAKQANLTNDNIEDMSKQFEDIFNDITDNLSNEDPKR